MHGVEPERVQVEVLNQRSAFSTRNARTCSAPSWSRLTAAPQGVVGLGEVGAEAAEVVPCGAEVVVDDIERDTEAAGVRGVDEALQRRRTSVGVVDGVEGDAVVAPAALARESGDRHQLDDVDAELGEVVEALDRRVERALGVKVPMCSS